MQNALSVVFVEFKYATVREQREPAAQNCHKISQPTTGVHDQSASLQQGYILHNQSTSLYITGAYKNGTGSVS